MDDLTVDRTEVADEPDPAPGPYRLPGRRRFTAANKPISCDDPALGWIVVRGDLDLFAVAHDHEGREGARHPICSVPEGGLVLGIPPGRLSDGGTASGRPHEVRVIAAGHPDSEVFEIAAGDLFAAVGRAPVSALIDGWIDGLARVLFEPADPWPIQVAEWSGTAVLDERATLHGRPNQVLWVGAESGRLLWLDRDDAVVQGAVRLPLVGNLMVRAVTRSVASLETTGALLSGGGFDQTLAQLMALASGRLVTLVAEREERNRELFRRRAEAGADRAAAALEQVADLLRRGQPRSAAAAVGPPLAAAFAEVANALGAAIPGPTPAVPASARPMEALHGLARAAGLNVRGVLLRGEWWLEDHGPLIGFLGSERTPIAILPGRKRGCDLVDPAKGTRSAVTPKLAAEVADEAAMIYPALPDRIRGLRTILGMGARGMGRLLLAILGLSLLTAVLALALPMVTAALIDEVIPRAEFSRLAEAAVALVLIAFGGAAFTVVRSLTLLRFEGILDGRLQSALFGRLLALPTDFFRNYAVGDLSDRVLGIQRIRIALTGATLGTLLQGLFSLVSFALLFYYNWRLALLASGVVFATAAVVLAITAAQRRDQAEVVRFQGRLDGFTVQVLSAIGKLRAANAEQRAFARWVEILAAQKKRQRRVQGWANWVETVNAVVPVVAPAALFVGVAMIMKNMAGEAALAALLPPDPSQPAVWEPMSTGDFLAFNAAFGQFLAAFLAACTALTGLLEIGPLIERAKPIFRAEPEIRRGRSAPGPLLGAIDLRHIVFRYDPSGPPVLSGLNLQIGAGEFVAIVGPSGSGKSTVVRLLLGFETPESGNIFFDGKPLDTLDVAEVRAQMGVVLQNGRINPGSIASNIIGASAADLEDAWAAARQVGLAADIEDMPMGMHTVLVEGAQTLSGGHRQRLILARALVHRPRILILDEATSALDNRTQAVVTDSLARLRNTRIVIAHRLSTIMRADRIVVIVDGRVAQSGQFEALMAQPGPFAELAKRQLTKGVPVSPS